MFIETGILVVLLLLMGAAGLAAVLGWIAESGRSDKLEAQLKKEIAHSLELEREIRYLKIKNNVQVATDYYNEGKKK